MASHGKFGTALNCMDGRAIPAVEAWLKNACGVDFVDQITDPGMDAILAKGENLERYKNNTAISVEKHHSNVIVVCGHDQCAGNPVSKEEHFRQIKKSIEQVNTWGFAAEVIGLWAYEDNGIWRAEKVA